MYRPGFLNGVQSIRSLRDDTKLGSSQTARNRFSKARKAIDNQTLKLASRTHGIQEFAALQAFVSCDIQKRRVHLAKPRTMAE